MNQRVSDRKNRPSGAAYSRAYRVRRDYPTIGGGPTAAIAFADFAICCLALMVTWWLRFETPLAGFGVPLTDGLSLLDYSGHIGLGAALMLVILINFRAYDPALLLSGTDDLRLIFRCTAIWLVGFLGLWLTLKIQPSISRVYCVLAATCIFFFVALWRHVLTRYILPSRYAHSPRRVVLVGWSKGMEQIAHASAKAAIRPFDIRGIFLPKSPLPTAHPAPPSVPALGDLASFQNHLIEDPPDGILVADRDLEGGQLAEIASLCEREMVDFEIVPSCFPSFVSGLNMKRLFGVPILGVTRLPLHSNINSYLKRGIDIVGASVGLVLSAPIIALFGYLIRRESPGPIFYKQVRVGQHGRPFEIIKLRSMRTDAETGDRPGWTVQDDPRCLKIGKKMRAWNIDELPQFWNVLKGEMSLVGPRPERPELIAKFKNEILHYNARHSVKPGITGWAQVNGLRGDTDLTERIRHDLHYIEKWNLPLDILILFRTLITRKGAC